MMRALVIAGAIPALRGLRRRAPCHNRRDGVARDLAPCARQRPLDRRAAAAGPHQWPTWAEATSAFAAAWFTSLDAPLNTSTGELAVSRAQASVDMERIEPGSATPFVYYGYFYCQMTDGRTFQYGPVKDLEYERHRVEHPPWLASYKSTAT